MFSVSLYAKFHVHPKESHLIIIKRNFRYLIRTPNLSIKYPIESICFELVGYFDAD